MFHLVQRYGRHQASSKGLDDQPSYTKVDQGLRSMEDWYIARQEQRDWIRSDKHWDRRRSRWIRQARRSSWANRKAVIQKVTYKNLVINKFSITIMNKQRRWIFWQKSDSFSFCFVFVADTNPNKIWRFHEQWYHNANATSYLLGKSMAFGKQR